MGGGTMRDGIVVKCPSCGQHIMVKLLPGSRLLSLECPFFECDFSYYVVARSIDEAVSAWNGAAYIYNRDRNRAIHV